MGAGLTSGGCCNCGVGGGVGHDGNIPFCFCTDVANELTMTTFDGACNFSMFQSCSILWYDPIPPEFAALSLGSKGFLSTESFPDPVAGDAQFWYYLTCESNQWTLTRVYLDSPYGSPFRDGILFSWLIGGPGNTCTPFALTSGTPFLGSDVGCGCVIEE